MSAGSPRPRALVLTQVYEPEPGFITADVAARLARDADVTVVTAHPNYPIGKFYPGVRWWRVSRSVENGVTVWRVPIWPNHSIAPFQRALCYLSYVVSAGIVAPFVAGRPDVVWVYHGPFTTGLAGLFFKFARGSRLVFTCADLWPESFAAIGVVRWQGLMRVLFAYRRWLNRAADFIICATRGTVERFAEEGYPRPRLGMVPVWIPGVERLSPPQAGPGDGRRHVVYAGNLGPGQRVDTIIRAAGLLRESHPDVVFDIYGSGSAGEALQRLARDPGTTNVVFHGRVPPQVAFERSASAAAQIVTLERSPFFRMTIPSKLAFAFATGSPLVHSLEGEAGDIAREAGAVFEFDSSDAGSLARSVAAALGLPEREIRALRERFRRYFSAHFAPSALLARYSEIFAGVIAERR